MATEKRLVKIGDAAKMLGCSHDALRDWDKNGELVPAFKSKAGTRFYNVAELQEKARIKTGVI